MKLLDTPKDGLGCGLLLGLGASVIFGYPLLILIGAAAPMGFFFFGVLQFIYLLPLILYYRGRQKKQIAAGIIVVSAFVFLLSAACGGLLFSLYRGH